MADYSNVEVVGIQISEDSNRIWVCINGECVLRVKGIRQLEITDMRNPESRELSTGESEESELSTGLPQFDPIVVAVALSLYAYNVSPMERANKIYEHFRGDCLELHELVRIMSDDAAYAATQLPYQSAVLYVLHALEKYGLEAHHRCVVNSGG